MKLVQAIRNRVDRLLYQNRERENALFLLRSLAGLGPDASAAACYARVREDLDDSEDELQFYEDRVARMESEEEEKYTRLRLDYEKLGKIVREARDIVGGTEDTLCQAVSRLKKERDANTLGIVAATPSIARWSGEFGAVPVEDVMIELLDRGKISHDDIVRAVAVVRGSS